MKIGIVGWGIEGQSAYRHFGPKHEYVIYNEEPRDDFPQESEKLKVQFTDRQRSPGITSNATDLSYLSGLETCDKIVYSVTAHKNLESFFGDNKAFWDKAVTAQHIFFDEVRTKNIIGVTGTKGKGTTSTLIYEMLKGAGLQAYLGGNIGTSVLDFLPQVQESDWVILELSNFQLYKFPYSPHIAVCLKIAPEHQDWHPTIEDYVDSKANIFSHQNKDDIAIYCSKNDYSSHLAGNSPGRKIPYFQKPGAFIRDDGMIVVGEDEAEIVNNKTVILPGKHNLENVCAAITAVWFGIDSIESQVKLQAISGVLKEFKGLPHRLELVREVDGISFYNDSFSSAPSSTMAAIEALPRKKILIIGGYDRGLELVDLAQLIQNNHFSIRKTIVIGASAERIGQAFKDVGYDNYEIDESKSMSEIVSHAKGYAERGDSVVLSPGFPSFDMFKNFEVRGNQFRESVNKL